MKIWRHSPGCIAIPGTWWWEDIISTVDPFSDSPKKHQEGCKTLNKPVIRTILNLLIFIFFHDLCLLFSRIIYISLCRASSWSMISWRNTGVALRPRWMINGRICRRSSKSGAARLEGRPSETGSSAVVAPWRQHPAIGYCLVKRLGRWLGRWLGEVSSIGWRMWWRWLFTGRWFSRGRCEFTGRIRKVIWSNMVMGPIWRQSQASSEWPIDVWEPPSLIHFWRANIHGKCRWDMLGYIFCDAAYSKNIPSNVHSSIPVKLLSR